MKVPFLDLGAIYSEIGNELLDATDRVMRSGQYVLGDELTKFESEFAEYCDARYAVGVGSGLDSLVLALKALDVGLGDEVLVPSNTFIATWLAVTHCGAIPVPVEPNERTYNLDSKLLEGKITQRTRAIIPVHLYGQPVELSEVISVARKYGLKVVEDAAQAHGASYNDKKIGSHGDLVAWSFYPGKNLGAYGDGGAITTNDPLLAERVRLLRNYGSRIKYEHDVVGYNSRLDNLQAAYLRIRLKKLDEWNRRRDAIAQAYIEALSPLTVKLPEVLPSAASAWHLFVIRHPERDRLKDHLFVEGVQTMVHYPIPPHKQMAYRSTVFSDDRLPIAEALAKTVLSLPIGPHLNDDQVSVVIKSIKKYYEH